MLKKRSMITAALAVVALTATAAAAAPQVIPQAVQQLFRDRAVPKSSVPAPSDPAKITADQAKEIAAKFVGIQAAAQAGPPKVEHMAVPDNGKGRNSWVVTFDGVARPPAGGTGVKAPPAGTKAHLQTTVFVDSETGEIWRAVEQGKQQ